MLYIIDPQVRKLSLNKYGLVKSGRRDRSLIIKELSSTASLPMRDQAYRYFHAVMNEGVKGVDFGGKEFSAAFGLFVFPFYKVSYTYPGETKEQQIDNYWEDHSLYQKALVSYQKYKNYFRRDPEVDRRYGAIISSIIGRLNYLFVFNISNNYQEAACGPLLDDYLITLSSPKLDMKELDTVRVKVVNATLEGLMTKCPTRQTEILNTKKHFQEADLVAL